MPVKFSKGQYITLERALRLALDNTITEAKKTTFSANVDHFSKEITLPANLKPEYWAKFGALTAAKYITDALALDSPMGFDREHFMAVVKGEKPVDSHPEWPRGRCLVPNCHKVRKTAHYCDTHSCLEKIDHA